MTCADEWFVWDPSPKARWSLGTPHGWTHTPGYMQYAKSRCGYLDNPRTWRGWSSRDEAVKYRKEHGMFAERWLVVNRAEAEALAASYLARRALEGV